jgi:hypothetical protein
VFGLSISDHQVLRPDCTERGEGAGCSSELRIGNEQVQSMDPEKKYREWNGGSNLRRTMRFEGAADRAVVRRVGL